MAELIVPPEGSPGLASPVRVIDGYKDRLSVNYALSASKTIVEIMTAKSVALTDDDVGVIVISDGTVQYNPNGEADANSGFLPTVYAIHGGKTFLSTVELYAAAETTVSLIVFEKHNG